MVERFGGAASVALALAAALTAGAAPAAAAETAAGTGRDLILVHDPYPPYVGEDLLNKGLASDIVITAFARAGYKATLDVLPWARALDGAMEGKFDGMLSAWYSEDRNKKLLFGESYLVNRVRFISRAGSNVDFKKLDDLVGKTVAVVRGYAYDEKFVTWPGIERHSVPAFDQAVGMLVVGRVDLTLEEERVARHILATRFPTWVASVEFLPNPLSVNTMQIAISRQREDHAGVVSRFNAALDAMRQDGTLTRILGRHGFGDDEGMGAAGPVPAKPKS